MLEQYGHGGDLDTAAEAFGRDRGAFLDYSSNMNPLGPPRAVERIMAGRWKELAQYPDPAVRKLTRLLARKHGVEPECILVGNGAAELIDLAVRALRPGVTGLVRPAFAEYEAAVLKSGGRVAEISLEAARGFELQLEDVVRTAEASDLLFLGHPNNPTGRLLPAEVRQLLAAGEIPAVVDEAFLDFMENEEELSLARAAARGNSLIVIRSMTKFYAIPGLRLGYAIAHPDKIRELRRLQVPWSVNALAQWIGEAVLEETAYEQATRAWLPSARAELRRGLQALGMHVFESDTNYLLVSLQELGISSTALQAAMGRRGILIRDASRFPGLDEAYCRLAVKLPEQNAQLLAGLAAALVELRGTAEAAGAGGQSGREAVHPAQPEQAELAEAQGHARAAAAAGPAAEELAAGSVLSAADRNAGTEAGAARLAPTLMLQGTASDVGKSLLTAALCRILLQDGRRVAPFKSQNMSLNSYVTPDGREIGRAQGMQADACRIPATTDMNPILLKPKKDMVSQVVVHGRPYRDLDARTYREKYLPEAGVIVCEALERLRQAFDVVVLEGAGSPAEVNLKDRDIVNMRLAGWADAPVVLVADIDRGGVFASLVGTLEILTPEERDRVKGFIINKFRGDVTLLHPGITWLEERTGKPVLGIIPYLPQLGLEDEDSASLERRLAEEAGRTAGAQGGRPDILDIVVLRLPRISNFTDIDPLLFEPDVRVRFVSALEEFGQPDAVIVPGSKNTVDDLLFLRASGLEQRLLEHARQQGGFVAGICAGYQMLGTRLLDPQLVESDQLELDGIGLFPTETVFEQEKRTVRAEGTTTLFAPAGGRFEVSGYEIHMGVTSFLEPVEQPFGLYGPGHPAGKREAVTADGAAGAGGRWWGTYIHGILHNDDFRRGWLNQVRESRGWAPLPAELRFLERREAAFDRLADHVRSHLDMARIYEMIDGLGS